jgi:hypothetical protein
VIERVGLTVSTVIASGVEIKLPALPAASAQLPMEKVIVPAAILDGGVKVAV